MFGTDLVDKSQVQYENSYYTYDPASIHEDKLGSNTVVESISLIPEIKPETKPETKTESKTQSLDELFNKFKDVEDDDTITLDRLKSVVANPEIPLNEAEVNWFTTNFPNIPIQLVKGLIQGKAFGRFLSAGKVLLSDIAAAGTLFHEAFHTVTQLYLTQEEINSLYKEARQRLNDKNLTDKQVEEILAEDFADYKKTGKILRFSPKRNTIFRRLLNILKDFLNIPISSIEDIYRRMDKGFYAKKEIIGIRQFDKLDKALPLEASSGLIVTLPPSSCLDNILILFFHFSVILLALFCLLASTI